MDRLVIAGDVKGQHFHYTIETDIENGRIRTYLNGEVNVDTWKEFMQILGILPEIAQADLINRMIV